MKPDIVFTEKGVSDLAQHYLVKAGITAIRRWVGRVELGMLGVLETYYTDIGYKKKIVFVNCTDNKGLLLGNFIIKSVCISKYHSVFDLFFGLKKEFIFRTGVLVCYGKEKL